MNKVNKFESYSGFLTWSMALLLSALAAGCGGGSGDGGRDPILGTGAGTGGVVGPGPGPGPVPGPVGCFTLTNTLANFGVLGGTALTCNASPPGTILITGDIGAPTQSCIPPQTAGFANYSNVGDPQLVTALADLQTATAAASGPGCPCATTLGATNLGGLARTPGTYCFTGAITLTGTFSLDGPGVYIFRTSSTLDTAANSIVQFANGATDANTSVYWIAVGATTLGADSVFKGTVMTSAAAITMSNNATLVRGRVLSGAAVTLANNVVTIP